MTGYRICIPPKTELHAIEIEKRIIRLRDLFAGQEVWFTSRAQVLDYLNNVVGARNEMTRPIVIKTLRRWRKFARFPYYAPNNSGKIAVSNLMIMAWLWEFRLYQALKTYKPHTKDLGNATRTEPGI